MVGTRRRSDGWAPFVGFVLAYVLCASAHAAVSVAAPPRGFEQPAATQAEARANEWARAAQGRVSEVFSTRDADGYYETLAVIEVEGALRSDLVIEPERALIEVFGEVLGPNVPPATASVELDDEGRPGAIHGRFDGEAGETWFVALASNGPAHALVILAVQTDEVSLYERSFATIVDELEGTAPPLASFRLARWRIGAASGWLMFAALAWLVVARMRNGDTAMERARLVAAACVAVAVAVFALAWFALERSADALALLGLSRGWVAAEAALGGIAAAIVVIIAGAIRNPQTQRIQSAPADGVYGRGRPPLPLRRTPPPMDIVPARIDGPSTLAPANDPPRTETTVRSYPPPPPKATETTVRSHPPPPPTRR
jgi:hypothetical protein